jgi:hypothetical protein
MGDECGGAAGVIESGLPFDCLTTHNTEAVARAVEESGAGDAACYGAFAGGGELERQCSRL